MIIWWRGQGLLIGFLAFFPVVAASMLGASNLALAFAASSVVIYLCREWIGEDSSLYSLRTRLWPPLLLFMALLVQFSHSTTRKPENESAKDAVANIKGSLPRMLNKQIRLDSANYESNILHYYSTSLVPFDADGSQMAAFEKDARRYYCVDLKPVWTSKNNIEFTLLIPPRTLNERVTTHAISLHPVDCQ